MINTEVAQFVQKFSVTSREMSRLYLFNPPAWLALMGYASQWGKNPVTLDIPIDKFKSMAKYSEDIYKFAHIVRFELGTDAQHEAGIVGSFFMVLDYIETQAREDELRMKTFSHGSNILKG